MIVEDETIVALNLAEELKSLGYEICEMVVTGEKAIDIAQQEDPDFILMDIILAGQISGIEAAIFIRERKIIPIIFTTGCNDEGTQGLSREVEPLAYLTKPIVSEEVDNIIKRHIKSMERWFK